MSLTAAGARPPFKSLIEQLGPSDVSYRPEEDTACQQYIGTPGQREGVSSQLPVVEEGPPPKLTIEQLKRPESPHPLTYKQPRRPAQIVWHETGILKDQYQRDRQREHAMTYARCEISIKKTER